MTSIQQQQAAQPGADARTQIREQVREQLRAQLEAQRAQLEAQRAALEAQTVRMQVQAQAQAEAQGQPGIPLPDAPRSVRVDGDRVYVDGQPVGTAGTSAGRGGGPEDIPPQAVDIAMGFFVMIAVIALGYPLIRLIRAIVERRPAPAPAMSADVAQRLDRIEQAVETVALEVERISEGQRFTSRLLADLRQTPQLAVPERVAEPRG